MSRAVRVGTRGSQLALRQTQSVVLQLQRIHPGVDFGLQIIKTSGDRPSVSMQMGEGIFVKELEEALRAGSIDMAVHSLKDVPSTLAPEFMLAAITKREDARDVLVTRTGQHLSELSPGAKIGTGSPRRVAQLSSLRTDLEVLPIKGNVDTRLRKTTSGVVDGVILAAAALHRLGLEEHITDYLPLDTFLPAVGQGALVIEALSSEKEILELVMPLDDEITRQSVIAERAFLRGLGGGCRAPIAAYSVVRQGDLELTGMFLPSDEMQPIWAHNTGPVSQAREIGHSLAQKILAQVRVQ